METLTRFQKYYRNNKEKRNKQSLLHAKKNGYKYQSNFVKKYNIRLREAIFEILGKKCVKCAFNDIRALQIDHINGGGSAERKSRTKNYYKLVLTEIISNKNKYQILCANCNWIKRSENKEIKKKNI